MQEGSVTSSDMRNALEKSGIRTSRSAVIDKCKELCIQYSMTIEEFVPELDAFKVNHNVDEIDLSHLGKIEEGLRKKSAAMMSFRNAAAHQIRGKRPGEMLSPSPNKRLSLLSASGSSPGYANSSPEASSPDYQKVPGDRSKYSSRNDSGQIIVSFNTFIAERGEFAPSAVKPLGSRVKISVSTDDFDGASDRFRYMFCTLGERANAIDKNLMALQKHMMAFKAINEIHPVRVPHQDLVWTCGRVCCDATEGKLNKTSIVIEGSRGESSGRTTHLELQDLSTYALFPGQVVLLHGIDADGGRFVVKSIVEGIPNDLPLTKPSKLLEYHYSSIHQGGKAQTIYCAAGPFTTNNDLSYEPLKDLLRQVLQDKPDVLVLLGPFVDIAQPLLADGDVWLHEEDGSQRSASYEMVFMQRIIRDCFVTYFNCDSESELLPTQIVIVPSLRDGHHDYVYPQPPFGNRGAVQSSMFAEALGDVKFPYQSDKDNKKRITLLPNPCMFRSNECLIGATSTDVLFALSSDEVSLNPGDRLARLAGHLLKQQSFFPMFPPPANIHPQLDFRQSKSWHMKYTPDILFVPSKLACMVKEIHGSLVINPGLLTKGSGGGTYARITINPLLETELRSLNSDSPIEHAVHSRTRVDIVKI